MAARYLRHIVNSAVTPIYRAIMGGSLVSRVVELFELDVEPTTK